VHRLSPLGSLLEINERARTTFLPHVGQYGGSGTAERRGLEDRLGGTADCFDGHIRIEKANDAAGAPFKSFVSPGERPDDASFAQHHLDIAAKILGMQQAFLKSPAVEREHILPDLAA